MCRHLAYLGPAVPLAEVLGLGLSSGAAPDGPASLYAQSWAPRRQRHGTVNADGFGVGWYPPHDPARAARYRRAVPIWADPDLPDLTRCLRSGAVLAAVRDASPDTSQDASAVAPYRDGRWLFSLNGAVPDWPRLLADLGSAPDPPPLPDTTALLAMEAHCDTALLWTLVLQRLRAGAGPDAALAAVVRGVGAVRPTARLNLLLTDGRTIAATRCGDSLWYRGADGTAPGGTAPGGAVTGGTLPDGAPDGALSDSAAGPPDGAGGSGTVLVASEPTDAHGGWREVPQHSVLLASRAAVRTVPLDPSAAPYGPPRPDAPAPGRPSRPPEPTDPPHALREPLPGEPPEPGHPLVER